MLVFIVFIEQLWYNFCVITSADDDTKQMKAGHE